MLIAENGLAALVKGACKHGYDIIFQDKRVYLPTHRAVNVVQAEQWAALEAVDWWRKDEG